MFTAIFGRNVSKFARSPKLWNRISDEYQIESTMSCIDSEDDDFQIKFTKISKKEDFIGGLLGSPLKSHKLINNYLQTNFSRKISAANCFFKYFDNWIFDNFDGIAALDSIKSKFDIREFESILILGSGPVAKSILQTCYLEHRIIHKNVFLISRKINLLSNSNIQNYPFFKSKLKFKNLIINATPLGSGYNNISPISHEDFHNMNANSLYFDANYGIHIPMGCKYATDLGIRNLDGSDMNLRQAIMGYIAVHKKYNEDLMFNEIYNFLLKCDL